MTRRWNGWCGTVAAVVCCASVATAQPAEAPTGRKGTIITIRGTIDSNVKNLVISKSRSAASRGAEVILYDFQGGQGSDFGPCYDLAREISELGGAVRRTVAFVNTHLTGHAVLAALACDEIVMAGDARIGEVYREKAEAAEIELAAYQKIARDKGHGSWVALALADRRLKLLEVTTPTGKQFVPAEQFDTFQQTHRVLRAQVVKESETLLLLDAEQAKQFGLSRRTASSRQEVADAYGLAPNAAADFAFTDDARPVLLVLEGAIDNRLYRYVLRRLKEVDEGGYNLVLVQINSTHGDETAANNIAEALRGLRERQIRTVAWVTEDATGPAVLLLFGSNELVVSAEARIGEFRPEKATAGDYQRFADAAVLTAQGTTFPEAVVRGLIEPETSVHLVRSKQNTRLQTLKTGAELEDPETGPQWEKVRPGPIKESGVAWKLDGATALMLQIAVGQARSVDEVLQLYGVKRAPFVLKPNWVDEVVNSLTSSGGTFFLLTLGFLCLMLELHMPGFGIPGVISVMCFVLFFWARFLSETANSLELVLFLLGLLLLAVELFILPGFGVTGLGGALLILVSLVLASQSSTAPEPANVLAVLAAFVVGIAAVIAAGRYLPRTPLFHRLVLAPAETPLTGDFEEEETGDAAELIGRQAIAVSPLRPAGRIELDGQFFDVVSQGGFVEPGAKVEILKVLPNRIVVKETTNTG